MSRDVLESLWRHINMMQAEITKHGKWFIDSMPLKSREEKK